MNKLYIPDKQKSFQDIYPLSEIEKGGADREGKGREEKIA